jgi:hypothetical protein
MKSKTYTIPFRSKSAVCKEIQDLQPGEWDVTIKEHKTTRSGAQHRLNWVWNTVISKYTGETKDEVHHRHKRDYLVPILLENDSEFAELWANLKIVGNPELLGKVIKMTTTTQLSTAQYAEYLNEVEFNEDIQLPNPEDIYWKALGIKK